MIDKIVRYEQNPPDASWNTDVLLVADDDESSFETISEQLIERLPFYYTPNRVYVGDYPPGDPTVDIVDRINAGSLMVNYTGHGNVDMWGVWAEGHIFDLGDVQALTNTEKLSVVTVANCLNAFFVGSDTSLAEALLELEDRGAVAVWAPTGLGYPPGHRTLMREFYEAIFQDDQYALGAATTAAKVALYAQSAFWAELVETFVLLGDPATQVGIPTNYPYAVSTIPADGEGTAPFDEDIQVVFSKPMLAGTVTLESVGGGSLPLTPTWALENTMVGYAHPPFPYGQTFTFTISGEDSLGNPLGPGLVPTTWSFTVTNDDIPPVGTIGVEGGDLTNVPVDATVVITFTEPMRTDSVTYTITPDVVTFLTWDASGEVATLDHLDFEMGNTYTFAVTAGRDVAGNPLLAPLEVTFTTRETHVVYLPLVIRNR
jgi:hypothetical protein